MTFDHVLVVGAGQMGGGIPQVVAGSGRRVSLYDAAPGAVECGLAAMRHSLTRLADKGGGHRRVVGQREVILATRAWKHPARPRTVIRSWPRWSSNWRNYSGDGVTSRSPVVDVIL